MSKLNSPQVKSVKKLVCWLLRISVRLKMPSKRYRSFKQAPFVETSSKERQSNVMTLYGRPEGYLDFTESHQRSHNVVWTLYAYWVKRRKKNIVLRCPIISCTPFVQVSFVLGELKLLQYYTFLGKILVEGKA